MRGEPRPHRAEGGVHRCIARVRLAHLAPEQVVLADEGGDEGRLRVVVEGVAVRHLFDHPLAHHRDVVGHGQGLALVVGDVDEGDADPLLDGAQLRAHVLAQLEIERGERFVEQQHVRFGGEGAGDGDPLALPAGQLVAHLVALAGEGDQVEQFVGPPAAFGTPDAAHLQGEGDVLPHRHEGEQGEVLEDEGGGPLVRPDPRHVPAADPDLAFRGLQKPGDGAEQGGLAAAGGSEEAEEPALRDVDVHVAGGDEIAELDPHAVELDPGAHRVLSVMAASPGASAIDCRIESAKCLTPVPQARASRPHRPAVVLPREREHPSALASLRALARLRAGRPRSQDRTPRSWPIRGCSPIRR